jgi:hypothetical protein
VQELQSADGSSWASAPLTQSTGADALPRLPRWAKPGNTWAPSVIQIGATFVMYYTATDASSGLQCISRATSSTPQGPYTDNSADRLVCQTRLGGSIDPSPFITPTGLPFLYWKSDDNRYGDPTSLWVQPLAGDGLSFAKWSTATRLLRATERWENGVIEGPAVTAVARADGSHAYYLFYGASFWDDASAGIGYATGAGPTGPWTKVTVDSPWVHTGSPGMAAMGPAGPTFFVPPGAPPFSTTQQFAYHGWYSTVGYANGGVRALWRGVVDFSTGAPVLVTE